MSHDMGTSPTPAPSPAPASPAPTAPAPAKETAGQKIENFFSKFGQAIEKLANAAVNVAEQELPAIKPLLPPNLYSKIATMTAAAAQQVAAADAKYAAIGQSNVPYATKVAEAVAVGGTAVVALAAEAGLQITDLTGFFSAAGQMAQSLNLSGITAAPKPVAAGN
jgi:hypothetical protein